MRTSTAPLDVDLAPGRPPLIEIDPGGDPTSWVERHRAGVRAAVEAHGALLLRGLGLDGLEDVGSVVVRLADDLVGDEEAFAERRRYAEGLYSSASWPPHQPMCMHHELSYRRRVPGLLLFACLVAPPTGGATGVADASAVLADLPADLVARFEREGWLLMRSYGEDIGAGVAESFGTDDRVAVERYCAAEGITLEWQADGGLRTWQRRPAVVHHPADGRRSWFNQVAFLSEWTLDPEIREYLVDVYGSDGLPFTTRFGSGDPAGADVVAEINRVYDQHTRREPWRAGDLLLVDNVRTAHSREAYSGPREVVVGMADGLSPAASGPGAGARR